VISAKERRSQAVELSCMCLLMSVLAIALLGADARPTRPRTISGTVRGSSGEALSGVRITLTNYVNSLSIYTAVSSPRGHYVCERLKAGKYILTAEATDFQPSTPQVIDLTSREEVIVDLRLIPLGTQDAKSSSQPGKSGQNSNPADYYEGSSLKPADLTGSIDAGGYSAAASAAVYRHLLQGAAELRSVPSFHAGERANKAHPEQSTSLAAREPELKKAVEAAPHSFDANHNLGQLYIQLGKTNSAIPYFEEAYRLNPSHYANAYDLALAYLETRNFSAARQQLRAMMAQKDTAEVHKLLAEVEGNSGNFLEAANEYQHAAQMEPSEQNIFDWGCQLLLHRTVEPAIDAFQAGVSRYPGSAKLWIGLGVALYSRGRYDDAVEALLRAADLNPSDPGPYLFLGKAYTISTKQADNVANRLKRFAELEPQNAQAIYYYALSLWKGKGDEDHQAESDQFEALLKKAASLDPAFPDPDLQLGILYASQHKYSEAIERYQQAVKLNPDLADAHYRLGQAYVRTGQKEQAQQEFELYERLHQQQMAEGEKQRGEALKFVRTIKEHSPKSQ